MSTPDSSWSASASAHSYGVAGSRVVPITTIGGAPDPSISIGFSVDSATCPLQPIKPHAKTSPKVGDASWKAGSSSETSRGATALGFAAGALMGLPIAESLMLGFSLSVASTVVLLRELEARRLLKSEGLHFDVAFTSRLKRAQRTLDIILSELGQSSIDIRYDEALKEAATVVAALPQTLASRVDHVEVATVDQITLVLRDERQVMWGSAEESELKAEVLVPLLSRPGQTYDISVPGQATVRP